MIQLIIIWTLLILAIALPWVITEVNFRKQVKELDKEFYREARRIDELEAELYHFKEHKNDSERLKIPKTTKGQRVQLK